MEEAPPLFGGVGCEVPNAKKLYLFIYTQSKVWTVPFVWNRDAPLPTLCRIEMQIVAVRSVIVTVVMKNRQAEMDANDLVDGRCDTQCDVKSCGYDEGGCPLSAQSLVGGRRRR
uniref:Uncharacterized protein n=2 Tax=Palpitomonas bilix TaxID=652834 RepID=A0A7S3DAP9_9EUKA|mmetsp:Transcript_29419/g.75866  ORF Transcript_29419/g.75866 Transcript_29419/m.75866 type:complete len:114 (+) Transcript_29419:247-588(+)